METEHLFYSSVDELQTLRSASSSFIGFCIPTRKRHKLRSKVGLLPFGSLMRMDADYVNYQNNKTKANEPHSDGQSANQPGGQSGLQSWLDDGRKRWHERKSCCACKPDRLVCYDEPYVRASQGASEVAFVVMDDGAYDFTSKTYYYRDRDKSTCCQHFWADIFPICLYCDCGTKDLVYGVEGVTTDE